MSTCPYTNSKAYLFNSMSKLQETRELANGFLSEFEPIKLIALTILLFILFNRLSKLIHGIKMQIEDKGFYGTVLSTFISFLRTFPLTSSIVKKKEAEMLEKISPNKDKKSNHVTLPSIGLGNEVLNQMRQIKENDKKWEGKCSGTVYMGGKDMKEHEEIVKEAYNMFLHSNPLHPDVFPSVVRFESDVISMLANLLNAISASDASVCGSMTSGGTESILMAVKASRDYMCLKKNIIHPELVIAESAHPAYDKACQYFKIRLRRAHVSKDYRADVKSMKKYINKNTIMVVASAPGFPHGVIDPIQEIGKLAYSKQICFHVDMCLGGFVLPFAKKLGYPLPAFDFEVKGVTSISIDTHKYGLCPKGSSAVLYRNKEIRKHQFVAVSDWSGGLYVSPSVCGSRSGATVASAYASLLSIGENGYLEATKKIMEATKQIIKGISQINGLHVLGRPEAMVVAFASEDLDIYKVNDEMTVRQWNLSALHRPPSLHICVTLQHVDVVEEFLNDLTKSVATVRTKPDGYEKGMAPIYGAASKMPDRGSVKQLLVEYMDSIS